MISTSIVSSESRSTGMSSEEMYALLRLPLASTSRRHPSYSDLSDNLSGLSQFAVRGSSHLKRLQKYAKLEWQEKDSEQPQLDQNTSADVVISTTENQYIGTSYDNGWSDLPKYTDFATIFTREEYMALAICYDIYGLSSSKIVAIDHSFETRGAAVLDLYWRFQTYDVLQSMKNLERPGESNELGDFVSFHYSDLTWSRSPRTDEHLPKPRPATSITTHFTTRLLQGDLAARLLQVNEDSLSRRGKADQGLQKWDHVLERRFRKRHGGLSPLEQDISLPLNFDPMETIFQDLERRSREKKSKKSPTSSSSSYESKSGYHSRSSSFSSESHIPGSIRGGMEFPFGYPMSIVDSLSDVITAPAPIDRGDRTIVPSRGPSPLRPKPHAGVEKLLAY